MTRASRDVDRSIDGTKGATTAYYIMFWEGLGNLFPWNAFITAAGYYAVRFCGTSFADNFENYFSISFMVAQTIGLALAVKYGSMFSLKTRIVYPLIGYCIIFLFTTLFVVLKDMNSNLLFYVTLLSACCCGICGSVLSGGLFGLAGVMPPAYTGAVMNGQGLAGFMVSMASILTIIAAGRDSSFCDDTNDSNDEECSYSVDYSAFAYFMIASVALVTCIIVFQILYRLPFTHFHLTRSGNAEDAVTNPLLIAEKNRTEDGGIKPVLDYDNDEEEVILGEFIDKKEAVLESKMGSHFTLDEIMRVLKVIRIPAFSVWFVFFVTIGLFPALTVLIESEQRCHDGSARFYNDLWTPFSFLMFNLFDMGGRFLASQVTFSFITADSIWMYSVVRVIFFPLFLLCRVTDSQLPVVFGNDAFPIIFMILFAGTNGYLSSLSMMFGPSLVDPRDSMLAGTIMVFCLTLGLCSGAAMSFVSVIIAQGHLG